MEEFKCPPAIVDSISGAKYHRDRSYIAGCITHNNNMGGVSITLVLYTVYKVLILDLFFSPEASPLCLY